MTKVNNGALTPRPLDVKEVREEYGLSQDDASALVHTDGRTWRRWESGESRMHPGLWELFKSKCEINREIEMKTEETIGRTLGLACSKGNKVNKIIYVEYVRMSADSVKLQAMCGLTLQQRNGTKIISNEMFDNRPQDAYSKFEETKWALEIVGWEI